MAACSKTLVETTNTATSYPLQTWLEANIISLDHFSIPKDYPAEYKADTYVFTSQGTRKLAYLRYLLEIANTYPELAEGDKAFIKTLIGMLDDMLKSPTDTVNKLANTLGLAHGLMRLYTWHQVALVNVLLNNMNAVTGDDFTTTAKVLTSFIGEGLEKTYQKNLAAVQANLILLNDLYVLSDTTAHDALLNELRTFADNINNPNVTTPEKEILKQMLLSYKTSFNNLRAISTNRINIEILLNMKTLLTQKDDQHGLYNISIGSPFNYAADSLRIILAHIDDVTFSQQFYDEILKPIIEPGVTGVSVEASLKQLSIKFDSTAQAYETQKSGFFSTPEGTQVKINLLKGLNKTFKDIVAGNSVNGYKQNTVTTKLTTFLQVIIKAYIDHGRINEEYVQLPGDTGNIILSAMTKILELLKTSKISGLPNVVERVQNCVLQSVSSALSFK